MSRQVDVKALVSHIVRGDGADKCRICMGDTSEGQVYLGDTVMMDEDKPVTLSEIIESITGVEVPLDQELPPGLCTTCSSSAMAAGAFRNLCRHSSDRWVSMLTLLQTLPSSKDKFGLCTGIYVVVDNNETTIKMEPVVCRTEIERVEIKTKCKKGNMDKPLVQQKDKKCNRIFKNEPIARSQSEENGMATVPYILGMETKQKFKKLMAKCRCPNCDKQFDSAREFHEHLVDSTDLQRACFICASMMTQKELIPHLKEIHRKEVYSCLKCPSLLLTLKQYQQHLQKSHLSGDYHCGDCGRRFPTNQAYNGHTSMHLVKNCPCCDKLFRNHRCYVHHVKSCCNLDTWRFDLHRTKTKVLFAVKNTSNQTVKVGARGSTDSECICDYCNKKFAGKKSICAHIQIVHLKNTHTPCHYCGKCFPAAHMSQHLKSHEKIKSHTCKHCGQTLKTKLGYVQHLRLHTGEKPYRCQYCTETFSASSRRSEHIRKTHKTKEQIVLKHTCNLCPAKFRLPFNLRKHMSMVHEKESVPGKTFECPECFIKFSSCRGMLHHRRTHQSTKVN